jgi:hypothetical protein
MKRTFAVVAGGLVENVIMDPGPEEIAANPGKYVEYSFAIPCGIGWTYDGTAFTPPQPYPSWVLDAPNHQWPTRQLTARPTSGTSLPKTGRPCHNRNKPQERKEIQMGFLDRIRYKKADTATEREFTLEDILNFLAEYPNLTGTEISAKITQNGTTTPANAYEHRNVNAPETASTTDLTGAKADPALSLPDFVGTVHEGAGAPVDGPTDEVSPQI